MPAMRAFPIYEFHVAQAGGASVYAYLPGTTTLADLYEDEALTVPAANPQILESLTVGDIVYGKLSQPVYTGDPIEVFVAGVRSGVMRPPLDTLSGEDASEAEVTVTDGEEAHTLAEHLGRVVYAHNYGELTTDPTTNTATINAAIGIVAARGGGDVVLEPGIIQFNQLTLPVGVRLVGYGRGVTTLQSQANGNVITLAGDRSGLANLTLDGINLVSGSIGVYAKGRSETRLDSVDIKRFETGMRFRGGRRADWVNLYIVNCVSGALLQGDTDPLGGADGDEFRDNRWLGGRVMQCTSIGVDLSFENTYCWHTTIEDVGFETNSGIALNINGARFTSLESCWFESNTTNLYVLDDTDTSKSTQNTVIGLRFHNGGMNGGAVTLRDTLADVRFDGVNIRDVDFTYTVPKNNVVFVNCIEDANVTISGIGTAHTRWRQGAKASSSGITTDGTVTTAWRSGDIPAGEVVFYQAVVLGNQRNGTNTGEYWIATSAKRPGFTLAYDNQTANFTVGETLTGATSGATAIITADSDSGTTGTLTIRSIVGTFIDNEVITDSATGSALANGSQVAANVSLLGSVTAMRAAREDVAGWDATFVANGGEVEVRVTGASSTTIDWLVSVTAVDG